MTEDITQPALHSGSRRASVIAAAAPLLVSACMWLAVGVHFSVRVRWDEVAANTVFATATSALGPFAPMFILSEPRRFDAMPWVALALWSAYLLLVAKSPLGTLHWRVLLAIGMVWCFLGTFMGAFAGLTVT